MLEWILLLFAVACATGSMILARVSMGHSFALTPLALFVLVSITFVNPGMVILFWENPDNLSAQRAVVAVSLGPLLVAVGGVYGAYGRKLPGRWSKWAMDSADMKMSFHVALIAGLMVFAVVALYFVLLGRVPLFGGVSELMSQGFRPGLANSHRTGRDTYINADQAYIPLQGLFDAMRYLALPMVVMWFLEFRRRGVHTRVSLAMVFTSGVLTVATVQRWPLMFMLFAVLIYASWGGLAKEQFKKTVLGVVVVGLLSGVLLSALLGRTTEKHLSPAEMVAFGARDLAERVLLGNVRGPFKLYKAIPEYAPYWYGWTYCQDAIALLPGRYENSTVTFNRIFFTDDGYTCPLGVVTELYVNFGMWGIVFGSPLIGLALAGLQWMTLRCRNARHLSYAAISTVVAGFLCISNLMFFLNVLVVIVVVESFVWVSSVYEFFVSYRGTELRKHR